MTKKESFNDWVIRILVEDVKRRRKKLELLNKLDNMTVAKGCTEEEAETARIIADRLR